MWPKEVDIYLHSNEETNYFKGEEIGLSEDAVMDKFRYALYEVKFTLRVYENGEYDIIKVNDKYLVYEIYET